MSTTIKRGILILPLVLAGWIAVMLLVMRFSDAAPAAVVPMPSQAFMAALPDQSAILDVTDFAVTFANRDGLTQALYQAGALMVLPAGLTGCLPLTPAQRAALATR